MERKRSMFLLATTAAMLATTAAPVSAQQSIYQTPEGRTFYGRNNRAIPGSSWRPRTLRWARETCKASALARTRSFQLNRTRPRNERRFPGENTKHRYLAYPGSHLFHLVGTDLIPSEHPNNVYARASRPYETRLANRIATARRASLEPAQVMRMALDVTGGDYRLAALTAHSVLKEATKRGRAAADSSERSRARYIRLRNDYPNRRSTQLAYSRYRSDFTKAQRILRRYNRIVRPLKSLRADPNRVADKMGPWYHIFALYTLDAIGGSRQALAAYRAEHAGKYIKLFFGEGGYDPEKKRIDELFITEQSNCRTGAIAEIPPARPPKAQSHRGSIQCPKTLYSLIPAYRHRGVDYAPGRAKVQTNPFKYNRSAECRYGRVGRQEYRIVVKWSAAKGPPTRNNICYPRWNSYSGSGFSREYGSKKKAIIVKFDRVLQGRNNYEDWLSRGARDSVAKDIIRQLSPTTTACRMPIRR